MDVITYRGGTCRSPQGECGLKWQCRVDGEALGESLPARGVWIEIVQCEYVLPAELSLPARGVWIEI